MKILTIATAWGSKHGGVNVFNYRMCCALVELGDKVTCYVKSPSNEDLQDAFSKNVKLLYIDKPSEQKWTPDDIGHVDYDSLADFDLIIAHDIIAKAFIDRFQVNRTKTCVAAFIHTLYSETDYFGPEQDDKRIEKANAQKALMQDSDIVFTSGTWGSDHLKNKYPELSHKIKPFVPGRLVMEPESARAEHYITSFGRLTFASEQKQTNAVLAAYKILASSFMRDEFPEGSDLPKLRLMGIECDTATQQEIKRNIFQHGAWDAQVEFLNYQNYYDFEKSRSKELINESKIVVTPSIVETFGLTSLEAIQLGIPLIAGRKSGFEYELRKTIRPTQELAIEWLDPSDYDDLPKSLSNSLRTMLRKYDSYRSGALSIANEINAVWPTWEDSCRTMRASIEDIRLSKPPKIIAPPDSPFAILETLRPELESKEKKSTFMIARWRALRGKRTEPTSSPTRRSTS
jgi:glycosyltransferase involved in cell wall biosynthesis